MPHSTTPKGRGGAARAAQRRAPMCSCSRWGLPSRASSPRPRCALTTPFHLCPRALRRTGSLISVALSLGSPPLAVSQHPTLWSPDFPPARARFQALTGGPLFYSDGITSFLLPSGQWVSCCAPGNGFLVAFRAMGLLSPSASLACGRHFGWTGRRHGLWCVREGLRGCLRPRTTEFRTSRRLLLIDGLELQDALGPGVRDP